MSSNVFKDIKDMHDKFGHSAWKDAHKNDPAMLRKLLNYRIAKMMDEEMNELRCAAFVDDDPEGVVDAIIDLMFFSVSILDLFEVDGEKAWNEVLAANMAKNPGIKPGRPNKFGLPDMIKPEGWQEPSNADNVGLLIEVFGE